MRDLDSIYRLHGKAVFSFLLSKTRDPQLAEELAQETFYQATRSIHRYDGSCKITTWLCQIAKHTWLKDAQKREQPGELTEMVPSQDMGPEEELLSSENRVGIFRLLHGLEEPMREVMYLRLSGELSFREIGEILDRDETWARVTFYRGKQKILKGGAP